VIQPAPLTCREMVELMNDYLEDALSPEDRARFEAHLSGCDPCTRYLAQIRETIEVTGRLTEEAVPTATRDELLRAFRDWRG
jgi:anti-sigma factor RsiW